MDFLSAIGPVIAFCGAIVAIIGNTWDKNQIGLQKVTLTGWAAAFIALAALTISIVSAYQSAQEKRRGGKQRLQKSISHGKDWCHLIE